MRAPPLITLACLLPFAQDPGDTTRARPSIAGASASRP